MEKVHIFETKFHLLKDQVNKGRLELGHYASKEQVADVFTKPLNPSRFEKLRELMGLRCLDSLIKGKY